MPKQIYFITSSLFPEPNSGGGSIVLYRHLKRFEEEGYQVIFINCSPVNKRNSTFNQVRLEKKIWYPPLRKATPLLTHLRTKIQANTLAKALNIKAGDIIIGLLEDHVSYLIYMLAKNFRVPFYLFFHDDNIYNRYFEENILSKKQVNTVIAACKHFFVVSEPMKKQILENGAMAATVIYPIPNGKIDLAPRKQDNKFNIVVSGMLLPSFFEQTIEKINEALVEKEDRLILIGTFEEKYKATAPQSIQFYDRFEKTNELYDFLSINADVLVVFYSNDVEVEIRSKYSFPSRFVEYCHLNIPIIIIAPESAAIGKWAIENEWLTFVNTTEIDKISKMIAALKKPDFRLKCLADCTKFATTAFDPDHIHQNIRELIEQ